jgi:ubiquinone/menaquinone biosynthesis C-methylase UbiE
MGTATIAAGRVFDGLADDYQSSFTNSLIGRAQRNAVWQILEQNFNAGDRILEINCGNGEDAIFLARRGASLVCCDASPKMIGIARQRIMNEPESDVSFQVLPTELLNSLHNHHLFDGVLSNFSGLNCVCDLRKVAEDLSVLTKPNAIACIVLSTSFCLWETAYYALHAKFRKAVRRWTGKTTATLNGESLTVYYPSVRQIRRVFSPHFRVRRIQGIGIFVPPSYIENWATKHRRLLGVFERIDRLVSSLPICRVIGDHMLLILERKSR